MTKNITDSQDLTTDEILAVLKSTLEKNREIFFRTDFVFAFYLIENSNEVPKSFAVNYLRLVEELLSRRASVEEFEAAIVEGETEQPQTALDFMDAKQELSEDWRDTFQRVMHTELSQGITDTKDWEESDILAKLDDVKQEVDWSNTTGAARAWWEEFETLNKARIRLVLRLAEELNKRKATITEFYDTLRVADVGNMQAVLYFLDYNRLKKEENLAKEKRLIEQQTERAEKDNLRKQEELKKHREQRFRHFAETYAFNLQKLGVAYAEKKVRLWLSAVENLYSKEPSTLHRLMFDFAQLGVSLSDVHRIALEIKSDDLARVRDHLLDLSITDGIFDGRYKVDGILSCSDRSVVCSATYITGSKAEVAIKLRHKSRHAHTNAKQVTDDLRREALCLVSCRHRNVVRLDDFHSTEEIAYMSLELCEGGTLASLIKAEERLDPQEAIRLFRKALEALDFIHATGIVHCNISPEHCLLTGGISEPIDIRLTSFSNALLPGDEFAPSGPESLVTKLDIRYAAPEVVAGSRCDSRSDLFSLGATFIEAITGRRMTGGDLDSNKLISAQDIQREMLISNSTLTQLATELSEALAKAVAPTPEKRWQTAYEILQLPFAKMEFKSKS
jgi:serine/threonine protein kinase